MVVMKRSLVLAILASLTLAACGTSSADSDTGAGSEGTVSVTAAAMANFVVIFILGLSSSFRVQEAARAARRCRGRSRSARHATPAPRCR